MTSDQEVHETFEDINHTPLRVYNRVVLMTNLRESVSEDEARRYAELFTESERKQMYVMSQFIRQKGVDAAKKAVTRDLKLAEEA